MSKVPVSVIILAKNEEGRIRDCIKSIEGWADEIIVVDDESQDLTRDLSLGLGARVITRKMDVEGRHRNLAYALGKHEWVLSIDADERVTEGLKREIDEVLSANPTCNALTIPRKNFLGDYWIRGGGLYPSPQLKLFRKDKFKWEEVEVHPRAFLEGGCGHLKSDLIHYTYRDWADFLRKLNNQTTLEARKWFNLSLEDPKKARYKMNIPHAIWRVMDRFVRTFFAKKGYRDGFTGFMIAYFASLYQIVSFAKYRALERKSR
ncbi:MAG: glycosyltransferase family 2 protein [Candidatus Omnitrophota bacterium]